MAKRTLEGENHREDSTVSELSGRMGSERKKTFTSALFEHENCSATELGGGKEGFIRASFLLKPSHKDLSILV